MKSILTLLLLTFSLIANGQTRVINCRVVAVSDGDTFKCLTQNFRQLKVRMASIDAPEKSQAFGMKAKQALSQLVYLQPVQLKSTGKDRYKRTLATVYDKQGRNINLTMIEQGMAWAYDRHKQDSYLAAEQQARAQNKGLWRDPNPIEPRLYRKNFH